MSTTNKTSETETSLQTGLAELEIHRYPQKKKQNLRAWDAADEYLLNTVAENNQLANANNIVVVNDAFGAIAISLCSRELKNAPVVITDSYLSTQGILNNMQRNSVAEESIRIIDSLQQVTDELDGTIDLLLIKLPKSLAMLEDQLVRLRPALSETTQIIAAGMTRHIHNSTSELFEKIIGKTHTSLAKKKARLICSVYSSSLEVAASPYPIEYALPYQLDDEDIEISNHAGVFSREKLDIGTRLFIENLPVSENYKTILDLGCGNGALGLMAAIKNPGSRVVFTDESYMAVDSAITNFVSVLGETREAEFLQTDCLFGVDDNTVSLILCNPPFHQNNAITDDVAWQMFSESKQALHTGGEFWVIGNRHLGYHAKLKHLFGNSEVVASNKKFTLLKAVKNA